MQKLKVELGSRSYSICIDESFDKLEECIEKSFTKALIVTDSNVERLFAEEVKEKLAHKFSDVGICVFEAGEKSKNIETMQIIYDACLEHGLDRKSCIIALGGGVTGDMAGFAAATFMRGIGFIQIPTTLLAQTDSSVGGKVGIDYSSTKNIIGAFKQPDLVYICTKTLKALPKREFEAGMAEVIKYSAIYDIDFLTYLEEYTDEIKSLSHEQISQMIFKCCAIKADVVAKDETEQSLRMILNFGHTIGHGIESAKGFELLHGECVSLGMICAFEIGKNRNLITDAYVDRMINAMKSYNLLQTASGITADEIIGYMKKDKKKVGSKLNFVLPAGEGKVEIASDITDSEVKMAISKILK